MMIEYLTLARVSGCGLLPPARGGCYCRGCDSDSPCPVNPGQVELARQWLRIHCQPRKTINPRRSSYGLKHDVEGWTSAQGNAVYVSNGAFIVAALLEGYRAEPRGGESINACFNISFAPSVRRMREAKRARKQAEKAMRRIENARWRAESSAIRLALAGKVTAQA